VIIPDDTCRFVFSANAPALEGSIAEQLKGYRKARGLFQRILADRVNVDHSTLSKIESSRSVPALVTFANIAYVLGLNARQVRGVLRAVTTGSDPSLAA
jgi:transcriptional regulator with XRE-family HTH domain